MNVLVIHESNHRQTRDKDNLGRTGQSERRNIPRSAKTNERTYVERFEWHSADEGRFTWVERTGDLADAAAKRCFRRSWTERRGVALIRPRLVNHHRWMNDWNSRRWFRMMNDLLQVTDHHIQLTHRLLMSDAGQFLFQGWPIHRSIRVKLMTMSKDQCVIRHCKSKSIDQWEGINFRRSTHDENRSDRGWCSDVHVPIRVANDFVWLRSDEPCVCDGIAIDEECVDHVRSVRTVWKGRRQSPCSSSNVRLTCDLSAPRASVDDAERANHRSCPHRPRHSTVIHRWVRVLPCAT